MYQSIEGNNSPKSSPLKNRTINHKSAMGLRTVETSVDPFKTEQRSMSPTKHSMSSKIKTQI
jgi:hypothetical protein